MRTLAIIILIFTWVSGMSQDTVGTHQARYNWTTEFGAGQSSFSHDDQTKNWMSRMEGGLRYQVELHDIQYSAGIIFSRKGEYYRNGNLLLDYLEIPLRLGFRLGYSKNWHQYLDFEGYYGILINEANVENLSYLQYRVKTKNYNAGVKIGTRIRRNKVGIGFSYGAGVIGVTKKGAYSDSSKQSILGPYNRFWEIKGFYLLK